MRRRFVDLLKRIEGKRQASGRSGTDEDTGVEEVGVCIGMMFGESGAAIVDAECVPECFLIVILMLRCGLCWRRFGWRFCEIYISDQLDNSTNDLVNRRI